MWWRFLPSSAPNKMKGWQCCAAMLHRQGDSHRISSHACVCVCGKVVKSCDTMEVNTVNEYHRSHMVWENLIQRCFVLFLLRDEVLVWLARLLITPEVGRLNNLHLFRPLNTTTALVGESWSCCKTVFPWTVVYFRLLCIERVIHV